jgi:hypothetical protein
MNAKPQPPKPDLRPTEPDSASGMVAVMLAVLVGGGFVVFLVLISFNFFLNVIAVAAAIAAFVALHYFLWGRRTPP